MPSGARRGLVAPQNTFLDTLTKRAAMAGGGGTCFILANAQGRKEDGRRKNRPAETLLDLKLVQRLIVDVW